MARKLKCECGICSTCRSRVYWRKKHSSAAIKSRKDLSQFPKPHQITVWECSDGREFSSETEALRYELDLFRVGTSHG